MTETERIKQQIKGELKKRPKIKIYCILCGEYCATISSQRELLHFDCWAKWKKSRQNLQ